MNKKGGVWITIVIAFLLFTLVAIVALTAFLVIPGKEIKPTKETISSDTQKADIYLHTINQINFLRAKAGQGTETIADLLVSAHKNRDAESLRKLDEAAKDYLKVYGKKCVTIDAWDRNNKPVWINAQSEACEQSGTGLAAYINPLFETDLIVPAENPEEYIVVKQKSIFVPEK